MNDCFAAIFQLNGLRVLGDRNLIVPKSTPSIINEGVSGAVGIICWARGGTWRWTNRATPFPAKIHRPRNPPLSRGYEGGERPLIYITDPVSVGGQGNGARFVYGG